MTNPSLYNRQSNIELLRIVAMMLVVWVHCNFYSLGDQKTFEIQSFTGVTRIFCEQLCIICVNVFVLISGWFAIKPKVKSILSFLFQVAFFCYLILVVKSLLGLPIAHKEYLNGLSFLYMYWFVPAYLILYVLSPVLNKFIENSSRKEILLIILCFYIAQYFLGWHYDAGHFGNGYTGLSFIGLYLLARYCRLYPCKLTSLSWKKDILIYLFATIIPTIYIVTTCKINGNTAYNSPFVIIASLYFFLAFTKLSFKSVIINWIACSAFAVYLLHINPYVSQHFKEMMKSFYDANNGVVYIGICILVALALLLVSTLLDRIRMIVWELCLSLYLKAHHYILKCQNNH